MFEIISALIPFFLLGIVAAGLSRVSGVALSMIIVPTLLIWGANAIDVIAFMLLFVVYNNFTMETQDVRLDYKDLVLFPKWRLCIPFILTIITAYFAPAAGIAVFMACFVLELLATVYKRIPENKRPRLHRVIVTSVLSAVVTAVGAYAGPKIPSEYYFICAGLAILVITGFAWYVGRLFGLYEFPRHGSFSYLAIGFAVAAVVCLYLVSPTPVGFDYINTLVSQPIVQ